MRWQIKSSRPNVVRDLADRLLAFLENDLSRLRVRPAEPGGPSKPPSREVWSKADVNPAHREPESFLQRQARGIR
jgi:hypothetical protein